MSSSRIAIVNSDKCKPKKCNQECRRDCPVVRIGKACIEISKTAVISETMCIGCGICVKKCPFKALSIVNLPKNLNARTTHRYGPNSFKLHGLPIPRSGEVLGLVGANGIGKSTAVKILGAKLQPNLGKFDAPPDWREVIEYFRGSELQNYFTKISENNMKAVMKPQYVDKIPKIAKGTIQHLLKDDVKIMEELDLAKIKHREICNLSGGELQRFAIAAICLQKADIYMFDEPTSYLDVKQRLSAAKVIRNLLENDNYVVVIEHDLSILDYLSDHICCFYGAPQVYGVVSMPFCVREGINVFLEGFIPTENMRFREEALRFNVAEIQDEKTDKQSLFKYPARVKIVGDFKLSVKAGSFTSSEIIVLLGQNGCGKTTFIRMLEIPGMRISYKPQQISPTFEGTVRELFHTKIRNMYTSARFKSEVIKPLNIDPLMDELVSTLSGGELQRVAIILCLGNPADIYMIDEPSAYLDSEQRIIASRVIKRFILRSKKTAFVVEHDFIMATYLADRVIVYTGEPAKECVAYEPQPLLSGMNQFLRELNVTFRRDPTNYRPRINKLNSIKDKEQKIAGNYFYSDLNAHFTKPNSAVTHSQNDAAE